MPRGQIVVAELSRLLGSWLIHDSGSGALSPN